MSLQIFLERHDACSGAREYCASVGYDWPRAWAECQRGDWMWWALDKLGLATQELSVRFAVACAERVAHLNPDPRVREAIDAAKAWIADPSEPNRKRCRAAADADAAAAYARAAAAADAADAAADADAAAAYARAAAAAAEMRAWQADWIRANVPMPTL